MIFAKLIGENVTKSVGFVCEQPVTDPGNTTAWQRLFFGVGFYVRCLQYVENTLSSRIPAPPFATTCFQTRTLGRVQVQW